MLKTVKFFNVCSHIKKSRTLCNKANTTCLDKQYFVSEDEIMENVFGGLITIGINLRESKNTLTETSLEKLNNSIKNFDSNDDLKAAILHGCGGNFCTGAVGNDAAEELSQDLMKTLHTLKKPIIASLDGSTTDFGLQLAMMCDIRIMDKSAVAGFTTKYRSQGSVVPPFFYERVVLTIGLARAVELMCVRHMWNSTECFNAGLVNKVVDSGASLGQAIVTAQSIAFNCPLENIVEFKSKILSALMRKAY